MVAICEECSKILIEHPLVKYFQSNLLGNLSYMENGTLTVGVGEYQGGCLIWYIELTVY